MEQIDDIELNKISEFLFDNYAENNNKIPNDTSPIKLNNIHKNNNKHQYTPENNRILKKLQEDANKKLNIERGENEKIQNDDKNEIKR